jgi:hypothetical protein
MDFFDKKQDVIEINLTQVGKEKLAEGGLKFEYYSFHDTDIVYDPSYLELTMSRNVQVNRIQDERQVLKANLTTKSIEQQSTKTTTENIIHEDLRHSFLGTSELGQKLYPALEIRCLKSEFSGSYSYETNTYTTQQIPVLKIEVNNRFDDRSKRWTIDEPIILAVNEINGKKEKKNFTAEFSLVDERQPQRPLYYPIYFKSQNFVPSQLEDEIILPEEESLEKNEVGYFFSVEVDHKILTDIEFSSLPPTRQQELRALLYDVENTAVIC